MCLRVAWYFCLLRFRKAKAIYRSKDDARFTAGKNVSSLITAVALLPELVLYFADPPDFTRVREGKRLSRAKSQGKIN